MYNIIMFTPKTFDKTSNTVALKPDTFRRAARAPWNYRNVAHLYVYEVDGIWVSKNSNTKGSLVLGDVNFIFRGEQYADLNFGDLIAFGRTEKTNQGPYDERVIRDVTYEAQVLVGNGNVWSGFHRGNMEKNLQFLLNAWFDLPNSPEGYTEWLTQKNKDN